MKKNINLDLQKSDYSESKVLIISTKWNEEVIQSMLDDCKETLKILKVNFSEVNVPGAFEIPFCFHLCLGGFSKLHGERS